MKSRFQNIYLLFLSCLYFFIRGRAKKDIGAPKKVLIVQLAKLGDMVCVTPLFHAVKEKYPACKVYVLGNRINKELLAGHPEVDGYIIYEKYVWATRKEIKKEQFDFACMAGPSPEILAMLFLSGIPLIAAPRVEGGFSPQETFVYKNISKFVHTVPHRMGNYIVREYLRLLEPIGIFAKDATKRLTYSNEAKQRVEEFFRKNNIDPAGDFLVGIFPSTGYPVKEWPARRFAKIADYLVQAYGAKVVVPGSRKDKLKAGEMQKALDPNTSIINAAGLFNLDELKALISRMKLFISVDTGPVHIAEAFRVPVVDIMGPMDEHEEVLLGTVQKIVKADNAPAQIHFMNSSVFDHKEARRQIEDITAEMVKQAIRTLVSEVYGREAYEKK